MNNQISDILSILDANKAEEIHHYECPENNIAKNVIVSTGISSTHTKALAEKIYIHFKQTYSVIGNINGEVNGDWVLLDLNNVIVHIFKPSVREYYSLDELLKENQCTLIKH